MRNRKASPSDVTDMEWEIVEPIIPAISPVPVHVVDTRRDMVNGIVNVLRRGCLWRLVTHDVPAWSTLSDSFRTWRTDGTWDQIQQSLLIPMSDL